MRTLLRVGALLGAVVLVNAAIDSQKSCQCEPECWCKRPGLRHFRWFVLVGHRINP